jgi:hypothetical protein
LYENPTLQDKVSVIEIVIVYFFIKAIILFCELKAREAYYSERGRNFRRKLNLKRRTQEFIIYLVPGLYGKLIG